MIQYFLNIEVPIELVSLLFLLYAETHYSFKGIYSRLKKKEPEIIADLPHRIDPKQPPNQFQIFVAKNRNRPINQNMVLCRFDPSRQTISESTVREQPNYRPEFDSFGQEVESLPNQTNIPF